jgi:hypothetical protein
MNQTSASSHTAKKEDSALSSSAVLSRRQIRTILNESLRSITELDAFLIDFFPEIYSECSTGMGRTAKLNLLLERADIQFLSQTVSSLYRESERAEAHFSPEDLVSQKSVRDGSIKYVIVLSAEISEMNIQTVKAVLKHLTSIARDSHLSIEEIRNGSVLLVVQGTPEGYNRIYGSYSRGELTKLANIDIRDVYRGGLLFFILRSVSNLINMNSNAVFSFVNPALLASVIIVGFVAFWLMRKPEGKLLVSKDLPSSSGSYGFPMSLQFRIVPPEPTVLTKPSRVQPGCKACRLTLNTGHYDNRETHLIREALERAHIRLCHGERITLERLGTRMDVSSAPSRFRSEVTREQLYVLSMILSSQLSALPRGMTIECY